MTYPCSIKVNRCNGNCNNISNPYARVCVPNIIKNITLKILDLISWENKTKQIKWHESCTYVCRLDPVVCNNKNPSNCKCEYKKSSSFISKRM